MKSDDPHMVSATSLIRNEVIHPDGTCLGQIKDLIIDLDTGHVTYAVLSVSNRLEMGEKRIALPWAAVAVDTTRRCILLEVDREWLNNAPAVEKDHWLEMPTRSSVHDLNWQRLSDL